MRGLTKLNNSFTYQNNAVITPNKYFKSFAFQITSRANKFSLSCNKDFQQRFTKMANESSSSKLRVAVVGAGISGLSSAYQLLSSYHKEIQLTVLSKGAQNCLCSVSKIRHVYQANCSKSGILSLVSQKTWMEDLFIGTMWKISVNV